MALYIPFIILILIDIIVLFFSFKSKRKNWGFICIAFLTIFINAINIPLYILKKLPDIRLLITLFYIAESFFYFFLTLTIYKMRRSKVSVFPIILIGILSATKLGLLISSFLGNKIISLRKHIFLGMNWWIAEKTKNLETIFNFPTFQYITFIVLGIILIILVYLIIKSSNLFRSKYLSALYSLIILSSSEIFTYLYDLPLIFIVASMNICLFIGLYFINYYSDNKLRAWSIMNFANELSDGFILYNEFEYPIHINDLMKNILPKEVIHSFSDKSNLDTWISNTINIENIEVLPYKNQDSDQTLYFKIKKNEIIDKGNYMGTIYTFHDTTDTIYIMQAMEKANLELERAAKMKSDFLANMSHEIRTPLNAVIGMTELAIREDLPNHVVDYIMQIQSSGKNLLNIINDILDFSKIEAGKMEIIEDEYNPLTEINDIASILMTRIGNKNLQLFINTDSTIPSLLLGDAMRIRQIIINLANNAIKFTKEGFVSINISCNKISSDQIQMTYHIIDSGSGIKEEDLKKLFVSFQQVDSKRNRSVEGTGLGLAISQKLCQAMDGDIGVNSEYGKGSDFYFTIPQKIVDSTNILKVEEAENKHAFAIDTTPIMIEKFKEETQKFNIQSTILQDINDYEATTGIDFIFLEEKNFTPKEQEFLKKHPNTHGVVLVDYSSDFSTNIDNVKIMRKPMTTLNIVSILNNKNMSTHTISETKESVIDFIAPDVKILIVDDNPVNITIAAGLIKPIKSQCISAQSGKEAIDLIKENDFDIVLMDHMMPEMDGIETTHYIRENIPKAKDLPIIALTANVMEGVKTMFLNEGFNDFVGKPIDIKELIKSLKKFIPSEKILDIDNADLEFETQADEEIIEFPGLNSQEAIKSLGSASLYKEIVEDYCKNGQEKHDLIQEQYETNDWENYIINVHALKSISRQIGASQLGDLAEKLEKAGKASEFDIIHENNQKLLDDYIDLVEKLKPNFEGSEEENIELKDISKEELSSILQNLSEACDELDMDSMEEISDELKKYSYSEDVQKLINDIYKAVNNMDVDECLELIEQINSL